MSSFSKDSRSITWHQWHVEYPTERKTGLSSRAAFANASSPQGYQSTGLCACCKRYGLFSAARRFCISGSECSRRRFRGLNARATGQAISKPVRTSDLKQHSSNRRNLPHWYPDGTAVFVTWRLHGTLPRGKRPPDPSDGGAFQRWDRELDRACFGPACLKQPEVATSVQQIIHAAETERGLCKLHGFVVMPNHVHVLLTPHVDLWQVTKWIKGASARRANQILHRSRSPFWQAESFDHWARSGMEFEHILNYMEMNPVRAGLVSEPSQWRFSSWANPATG